MKAKTYKLALTVILFVGTALSLVSCDEDAKSRRLIHANCDHLLNYDLEAFDGMSSFLRDSLKSSTEYFALKKVSPFGFEIVVLSTDSSAGRLVVASPSVQEVLTLDLETMKSVANAIAGSGTLTIRDHVADTQSFQRECAFVRFYDGRGTSDALVANASRREYQQELQQEIFTELALYFVLDDLLADRFPVFYETRGNGYLEVDEHGEGPDLTELKVADPKSVKRLRAATAANPFFELDGLE